MIDFKIKKGLSTDLYVEPGVINPRLIIEEGCWYLCTDTADLFLGVYTKDENGQDFLTLKQINGDHEGTGGEIDLTGYATEQYVNEAITAVSDHIEDAYYTKSEVDVLIPDVSEFIKDIPAEYVTEEELAAKGYLTEHQSLEDYAKKSDLEGYSKFSGSYNDLTDKPEIPSIEGLATEEFVQQEIAKIDIPEVNLDGLVTNETFEQELVKKANEVPFTTAKFVAKAVGGFAVGDSVKDFTITELFAKLLGLSDTKPGENPDTPIEPDGVVEEIVTNKLPMYSVNANGEVVEISYDDVITYTESAAQEQPTEFGFYQIINEAGEVIESGYQELTAENPNVPYIIALPIGVDFNTMVTTQTYDTLESAWKNDSLEMSDDYSTISGICESLSIDISHIDTEKFTLWADLSSGQGPSGKIHRFIINE